VTGSVEETFDTLMGELVSPMVVVTTASGGTRAGCLVGFHVQCGLEPPRYAIWLSKANRTYKVGALSEVFAVHFLARGDRAIAELFGAATGDEVDKFDRCSWTEGEGGVPLVDACPNRFTGRRTAWLDAGDDHVCIVLEPVEAEHVGLGRPLSLFDVVDLEPGHGATERQRPR